MATRSGRRNQDSSSLSTLESLIFAQAVYEFGVDAWPAVAKILSKHPLLSRPKSFFTPQSCHNIYINLMKEAELECTETSHSIHAPENLKLAQRHYQVRFNEIRSLLIAQEVEFKKVVAEIDQIRSGAWDTKISSELIGNTPEAPGEPVPNEVDSLSTATEVPEVDISKVNAISLEEPPQRPASATSEVNKQDGKEIASDADLGVPSAVTTAPESHSVPEAIVEELSMEVEQFATPPEQVLDNAVVSDEISRDTDDALSEKTPDIIRDNTPKEEGPQDVKEKTPVERAPSPPSAVPRKREVKRKVSDIETVLTESTRDKKRLREESEPVDEDDSGSNVKRRGRQAPTEDQLALKRFQNVITMLHSQISQHRSGNIFHNPIRTSEAPDYHDIVKRPMDLKTIKTKIKDGAIANSLEFQRDVYLMFANAMMYNRPGSDIYQMAEEMMLESEVQINTFRQTEGFARGNRL